METEKKAKLEKVLQEMFGQWKNYAVKEGTVVPICMVVTEIRLGKKDWRGMGDWKAQEEKSEYRKGSIGNECDGGGYHVDRIS